MNDSQARKKQHNQTQYIKRARKYVNKRIYVRILFSHFPHMGG